MEKAAKAFSGLVLVKKDGKIYFIDESGFFPGNLSVAEQVAIDKALEAQFGLPAVYGKLPIKRPGGAK